MYRVIEHCTQLSLPDACWGRLHSFFDGVLNGDPTEGVEALIRSVGPGTDA
jgi:hypothetical protein